MTHIWQRRALAIAVLVALLGLGIVLGGGAGATLARPTTAITSSTDHAAFASLPDSRQAFGYVEPLALFGLGLVLVAGLFRAGPTLRPLSVPVDAVGRRRWRARLEGAPPIHS